jgi:type VI protein secretion system component VasK
MYGRRMVWLIDLSHMSTTDVAAWATVTLAGVGVVALLTNGALAYLTWRMAVATNRAAQATQDEAKATQEEARATLQQATATQDQAKAASETLAELKRTRELDWRPDLVWKYLGGSTNPYQVKRQMRIQNLGRGPALNAIYMREEDQSGKRHFILSEPLDLAAGAAETTEAVTQSKDAHPEQFTRDTLPREQMICTDQFYTWYRFWPRTFQPETYTVEFDEERTPQTFDAPGWVRGAEEILFGANVV